MQINACQPETHLLNEGFSIGFHFNFELYLIHSEKKNCMINYIGFGLFPVWPVFF